MNENSKFKINRYSLISFIIQKKLYNNKSMDSDILIHIKKCISLLKQIDMIYTLADIEAYKYNNTKYPDSLLWYEINIRHSFFATILGYIDGNINNVKHKDFKLTLLNLRNLVIEDYRTTSSIADPNIYKNIINSNPCYTEFDNYFKKDDYIFNDGIDIIVSYTMGYTDSGSYNIYDFYYEYKVLFDELISYKNRNRDKFIKVKKNK